MVKYDPELYDLVENEDETYSLISLSEYNITFMSNKNFLIKEGDIVASFTKECVENPDSTFYFSKSYLGKDLVMGVPHGDLMDSYVCMGSEVSQKLVITQKEEEDVSFVISNSFVALLLDENLNQNKEICFPRQTSILNSSIRSNLGISYVSKNKKNLFPNKLDVDNVFASGEELYFKYFKSIILNGVTFHKFGNSPMVFKGLLERGGMSKSIFEANKASIFNQLEGSQTICLGECFLCDSDIALIGDKEIRFKQISITNAVLSLEDIALEEIKIEQKVNYKHGHKIEFENIEADKVKFDIKAKGSIMKGIKIRNIKSEDSILGGSFTLSPSSDDEVFIDDFGLEGKDLGFAFQGSGISIKNTKIASKDGTRLALNGDQNRLHGLRINLEGGSSELVEDIKKEDSLTMSDITLRNNLILKGLEFGEASRVMIDNCGSLENIRFKGTWQSEQTLKEVDTIEDSVISGDVTVLKTDRIIRANLEDCLLENIAEIVDKNISKEKITFNFKTRLTDIQEQSKQKPHLKVEPKESGLKVDNIDF